jgi:membrane protein
MKIPGMRLIKQAESKGNEIEVPVAENLGLVDFFKLTYKEMNEDHVTAFAGNLTYKGLFAIFPFFTFLLSLLGLFNATDLVNTMVDKLSGIAPQSATKFIEVSSSASPRVRPRAPSPSVHHRSALNEPA